MRKVQIVFILAGILGLGSAIARAQRSDSVIADFEGNDYGDWIAKGTAFANAPAGGTLPHQMPVDGFHGHGLVNSFNDGDDSTGTLTSLKVYELNSAW